MKQFLKKIFYNICVYVEIFFPSHSGHILMYHSFDLYKVFFNVSTEDFQRQIIFLQNNDYKILSLEDFLTRKEKRLSLSKCVVITCDDGYVWLEHVAKFLNSKDIPVTIFWPSGMLNNRLKLSSGVEYEILSSEQLLNICRFFPNVSIGSHGVTHRELPSITPSEISNELHTSLLDIEIFPKHFAIIAYPRGKYNQQVIELSKASGYIAGLTTREGGISHNTPNFELRRLSMDSTVNLLSFRAKMTRLYDFYARMTK